MTDLSNDPFAALDEQPTSSADPFAVLDQPAPEPEGEGSVLDALGGGISNLGRSIGNVWDYATGDVDSLEERASAPSDATPEQKAFRKRFEELRAESDETVWDGIKNVVEAAWDNPTGALHEGVAQLPNMGAIMGGAYAGMKVGATGGTLVTPGAGTVVGGIAGAVLGMFSGNYLVEGGAGLGEAAAEPGRVTEEQLDEASLKAVKKSGVITAIDTATFGLSRMMMGAPGRLVERAVTESLVDQGVDVSSEAAMKAVMKQPAVVKKAMDAGQQALEKANTLTQRAKRGGGGMALETAGEGTGEYFGTLASGEEASISEAVLESMMALPMSVGELYVGSELQSPGEVTRNLASIQRAQSIEEALSEAEKVSGSVLQDVVGPPLGGPAAGPTIPTYDPAEFGPSKGQLQSGARQAQIDSVRSDAEQADIDSFIGDVQTMVGEEREAQRPYRSGGVSTPGWAEVDAKRPVGAAGQAQAAKRQREIDATAIEEEVSETSKGDVREGKLTSGQLDTVPDTKTVGTSRLPDTITPKKRDHYRSEAEAKKALEVKHRLTNDPVAAADLKAPEGDFRYEPVQVGESAWVLRRKDAEGPTYTTPDNPRFETTVVETPKGEQRILVKGDPAAVTQALDDVGVPRKGRIYSKKRGGVQVPMDHQAVIDERVSLPPGEVSKAPPTPAPSVAPQTEMSLLEAKQYLKGHGVKSLQVSKLLRRIEPVTMDEAGRDAVYAVEDLDRVLREPSPLTDEESYRLVDKLEKDLSPVGQEEVRKAFPTGKVREVRGGYSVDLPNGLKVRVKTDQSIEIDEASARRAYGSDYRAGQTAAGSFTKLDKESVIALAKGAGQETLHHEAFHAAFRLALSPAEQKRLIKKYGSEEKAAQAYETWSPSEKNGLFAKIMRFFRRLAGALSVEGTFEKVRDGSVFERSPPSLSTKPLSEIKLTETVRLAETGETVEIEMTAEAALAEVDDRIEAWNNIKACLV